MTLTKTDIIRKVREKVRMKNRKKGPQLFLFPEMDCVSLQPKKAAEIVDHLFEIMKRTLAGGDELFIRRFGKFRVRFKWARPGRNPRTGREHHHRVQKAGFLQDLAHPEGQDQ